MSSASRAPRMKALGMPSCTARRLTWDSGVWGTVEMMPATRGEIIGQRLVDHDVAGVGDGLPGPWRAAGRILPLRSTG